MVRDLSFPNSSVHEADPSCPAPDTGIVNFYQLNDTLMAHVDRAEWVISVVSPRHGLRARRVLADTP
jgi:alkylated DNA repair dioxygenase AlkB